MILPPPSKHRRPMPLASALYILWPKTLDELDRIKALGLKGVKLHPDYQRFLVDDPRCIPIYEKISRLGLITVFHTGLD